MTARTVALAVSIVGVSVSVIATPDAVLGTTRNFHDFRAQGDSFEVWPSLSDDVHTPLLLGYGSELLFQSLNDTELNALVRTSGSELQRYPGGTPSGFWNWELGWESPPFPGPSGRHDKGVNLTRPSPPLNYSSYLSFTGQDSIFVPNILTSNMSFEMQGLLAMQKAGVRVGLVEMGNEMYDKTVPEIAERFPTPEAYSTFIEAWVDGVRELFPDAEIALCGSTDVSWLASLLNSTVGKDSRNAVTMHVYTGLPEGPYQSAEDYRSVVDLAIAAVSDVRRTLGESAENGGVQLPHNRRVWFTEVGVFGATFAQRTWLKALMMFRKTMLLGLLPWAEVVLPYCLVCGDPNAPSFTTPLGPQPAAVNASDWRFEPTGLALNQLFLVAAGARTANTLRAVHFGPAHATPPSGSFFDNFCVLPNLGPAGPLVGGCAAGDVTTSNEECFEKCQACDGCAWWQRDPSGACWLKPAEQVSLGANLNSSTGSVNCSGESFPVNGLVGVNQNESTGTLLVGNFADVDVTLSAAALHHVATQTFEQIDGLSSLHHQEASPTSMSYSLLVPANRSVVVAQGLDPEQFIVRSTGTVHLDNVSASIRIPAYSLGTFRWQLLF